MATVNVPAPTGPTTLTGTWTWDGTATVLATDTSQVSLADAVGLDSDGQFFSVASVVPNTSVTIRNPAGLTIPSGATGSSFFDDTDVVNIETAAKSAAPGDTLQFADGTYKMAGSEFFATGFPRSLTLKTDLFEPPRTVDILTVDAVFFSGSTGSPTFERAVIIEKNSVGQVLDGLILAGGVGAGTIIERAAGASLAEGMPWMINAAVEIKNITFKDVGFALSMNKAGFNIHDCTFTNIWTAAGLTPDNRTVYPNYHQFLRPTDFDNPVTSRFDNNTCTSRFSFVVYAGSEILSDGNAASADAVIPTGLYVITPLHVASFIPGISGFQIELVRKCKLTNNSLNADSPSSVGVLFSSIFGGTNTKNTVDGFTCSGAHELGTCLIGGTTVPFLPGLVTKNTVKDLAINAATQVGCIFNSIPFAPGGGFELGSVSQNHILNLTFGAGAFVPGLTSAGLIGGKSFADLITGNFVTGVDFSAGGFPGGYPAVDPDQDLGDPAADVSDLCSYWLSGSTGNHMSTATYPAGTAALEDLGAGPPVPGQVLDIDGGNLITDLFGASASKPSPQKILLLERKLNELTDDLTKDARRVSQYATQPEQE